MNSLLVLSIASLFYIGILSVIFFCKKKVSNRETKLYRLLIIMLLIEIVLEISMRFFANYMDTLYIVNEIIAKVFVYMSTLWFSLITLYNAIISNKTSNNHYKNIKKFLIFLNIIAFILSMTLSINFFIKPGNDYYSYTFGPSVNVAFIMFFILMIFDILILILNYKNLNKKHLPVFLGIVFFLICGAIQKSYPELTLNLFAQALVTYIMYHTIENPDVKMINELELAKNQAEKANRAKTDFLSSMSHEIRTPLNAIVGLSNVIKESDDLNEIHEDASDVVSASNTLLEIVNGILDISRIEADKMEIVEVSYNPLEEFKSLVNLTETRIGEKEIELRSEFAVDLPETLYGDKGKVKQIITNLLSNAVKYTEKGYIDFKVSCINEKDISKLTITVSDTGRGIKKEQMDTLFTKFNRLEEDKNTTIEGTGLGLAITKSLVEMMGGKIVVDSTYGEGSKFTVFLSQKITNDTTLEKVETINIFDGKKVLVVDDNKLNIKVAIKILKEFNLDIDECESGFECINKIENNNKYDIIFMDIMMPKMSGTETLKKLKQIENFNTPVVALTADAIQGKSNKYLEVGFNDYLSKPIDKNELNKVLNKILNNVEVEEQKKEENPDIHKVTPITDEQIAELNRLFGEPTLISKEEIENRDKEKHNH